MEDSRSKAGSPLAYLLSFFSAVCAYFKRLVVRILIVGPIPEHIAIIMDGNRRFADRTRIDRTRGHLYGYDRLINTLDNCLLLGVKYVSVYAFSIDNFRRPKDEVNALMTLMEEKLDHLVNNEPLTKDFGVRVQVLGDLTLLPSNVRAAAERAMLCTKDNRSVVLNLCVAYTSTAEIVHSIEEIRGKALMASRKTISNNASALNCAEDSRIVDGRSTNGLMPAHEVSTVNGSALENLKDVLGSNSYRSHLEIRGKEQADVALSPVRSNELLGLSFERSLSNTKRNIVLDDTDQRNAGEFDPNCTAGEEFKNVLCTGNSVAELRHRKALIEEPDIFEERNESSPNLEFITAKEIESHLYTAGCPPPDLLIRTSGETRLSNFLLWQCSSFSHLAFCKVLWPEFSFRHLAWIILDYQRSFSAIQKQRRLEDEFLADMVSLHKV